MPIETKDLVIYESERLTDNSDGGGKYNGKIIVDGKSNNVFDDISEMDRTMGDVSMRKIFPAVTTADTDKLMGSTVFISELPKDPNVSALLFSTKNWTDERSSAQNRVENYLAKGSQIAGTPLDTHWQGMRSLQVAMFPTEVGSSVGDTIVLISNEGKPLQVEQYLRITKVESRNAILIVNEKQVEYKISTYTLNDPLVADFVGLSAKQWYNGDKSTTIIRDSIVADTGNYYGSVGLKSGAQVGEFTVNAKDIFTQLIPSAQTETPIIDVNASGESFVLVAGNNGLISANFQTTVGVTQNLYIGSSVIPSSVSFMLFGQSVTDQGGLLKTSNGTQVGTIDYQRGLIQWTASATTGATTLNISFKPAAAPNQYFQSYSMPVTKNNQSINWTGVLVPIPAPGTLSISYMAQGKFYELKDDGSGQLKGSNSSFGSGLINYETGSWLLTTGALPDVDTPILLLWGTPITTFVRSGLAVAPAGVDFTLFHNGIATATVTWMLEGVAKTATLNSAGKFTGDATGYLRRNIGKGRIIPAKLPQQSTVFTITYTYGAPKTQTVNSGSPDGTQKLNFTIGTGAAIEPNSVTLDIPVNREVGATTGGTVTLHDEPVDSTNGKLVNQFGVQMGTIVYATGACEVTPTLELTTYQAKYTPFALYTAG